MAATTSQLNALASDPSFRRRVRTLILMEASAIYGEDANLFPNHQGRAAYAVKLTQSPGLADQLVDVVVTRTNLVLSTISYDFDKAAVVTTATDGDIRSQINTDWNMLSGA